MYISSKTSGYFSRVDTKLEPLLIEIAASLKTILKDLSSVLSERIFKASKSGNPVFIIEANCLVAKAKFLVDGFFILFLTFLPDFNFKL